MRKDELGQQAKLERNHVHGHAFVWHPNRGVGAKIENLKRPSIHEAGGRQRLMRKETIQRGWEQAV